MVDIPIVGMTPVAEAGFPDVECPAIFLPGCNLRCPYCLNASIVRPDDILPSRTVEEVLEVARSLGSRSILISGGEPCLQPRLHDLASAIKSAGFGVRLSTNGTCPDVIQSLVEAGLLEFVAMDLKCILVGPKSSAAFEVLNPPPWTSLRKETFASAIIRTIATLETSRIAAAVSGSLTNFFSYEIRTTLFPPLVDSDDLLEMAKFVPLGATWILQQYRRTKGFGGTLPPPYSEKFAESLLEQVRKTHPSSHLRWP